MEFKCYLKARRNKNMKKHFIEVKNLAGFFFIFFCLVSYIIVLKHCKDTWNALTYDLRIRNTDPRSDLVSCFKKRF